MPKFRKRARSGKRRRSVSFSKTSDGQRFSGKRFRGNKRQRRSKSQFRGKLLREIEPWTATLEGASIATSPLGACTYQVVANGKNPYDYYTISQKAIQTGQLPNLLQLSNIANKYYIKLNTRAEIFNHSLVPINIVFYTCIPRFALPLSIFNTIGNSAGLGTGTYNSVLTTPTSDTDIGLAKYNTSSDYQTTEPTYLGYQFAQYDAQAQSGSGSYALHTVPSLSPFDSPSFTRCFKITSVKQSCVNPGKCFSLTIKRPYKVYDPITQNAWITAAGGHAAFKGEPFIVMKLFGNPVYDANSTASVSLAPTKVAFATMRKYQIKLIQRSYRTIVPVLKFTSGFIGNPEFTQQPQSVSQTGVAP